MMLPTARFWEVIDRITFKDWQLVGETSLLGTRIRWCFNAPCSRTGTDQPWFGRWWDVTDYNEEQVVKTAFAALKLTMEHELMEFFKYKGVAIFDPHTPLADLMQRQPI